MVVTIENVTFNTEDITYINMAYKVMGMYVIRIFLKSENEPVTFEYWDKGEYDKTVVFLESVVAAE